MKKIFFLCATLLALTTSIEGQNMVKISGHVVDSIMQEDFPFVYIDVLQTDSVIARTYTDLDGNFRMRIPVGEYMLHFAAVGCYKKQISIMADKDLNLDTIVMVVSDPFFYDNPIYDVFPPVIEIDPNGASQQMEVDGVKVIVR